MSIHWPTGITLVTFMREASRCVYRSSTAISTWVNRAGEECLVRGAYYSEELALLVTLEVRCLF